MSDTTPVLFTAAELWILHSVVRHEYPAQNAWQYPPANHDLNDQIAAALLFCDQQRQSEASLQVSWGDLLAIDYWIRPDMKDADGKPVGRVILLKTFAARTNLKRSIPGPDVPEPAVLDKATAQAWLRGEEYDNFA